MTKMDDVGAEIVWWEKSVEYTFIAEMVWRDMFTWAAPLAGNPETALGDAITDWDGRLLLIEFKRDSESLTSEYKKYSLQEDFESTFLAYNDAKAILGEHKGVAAHGLIYGQLNERQLKLRAVPYWETSKNAVDVDEWCDTSGVSQVDFEEYLVELSSLRFTMSEMVSGAGGSSGSSGSGSFVVGIGKDKRSFALQLERYVNLRPKLTLTLKEEQRMSFDFTP
ncbi:hypothetical protein [Delftia lacustris]|uniref:hypothetical protein n=1 Tax=Delftia lacustris TaxID=558537 RepID=UPI0035A5C7F2